ncbi:hypothetical protein ABTN58_19710, partial [Acinetobacter baumannii]
MRSEVDAFESALTLFDHSEQITGDLLARIPSPLSRDFDLICGMEKFGKLNKLHRTYLSWKTIAAREGAMTIF